MTEERDPYKVLGVAPEASDAEVREAYRERARRLHPDVVGESALGEMRALNQAWALLKDPGKRAMHDAAHGHRRPGATPGDGGGGAGGGSTAATGAKAAGSTLAGQPEWTGAAGPPPGRPWGSVLTFGIYAGWSLGEIARRDRGYLGWLKDKPEGKRLRQEIEKVLEATAPDSASSGQASDRRRR